MLRIQHLQLPYRLHDFSAHASQGKLIGIMGGNGAGKSTLLKSLAGILRPKAGEMWLGDTRLDTLSPVERSAQLSYLAQQTPVHWDLLVRDVIWLGARGKAQSAENQANFARVTRRFALEPLLDKRIWTLSGGEKTRVQLARCLMNPAPLLLADEPIAPLDPYFQLDIMQQLKQLTPEMTCLIAIHHLDLAYRFCDEIWLLKDGKLLAMGETEKVLTPEHIEAAFGVRVKCDSARRLITEMEKAPVR